MKGTLATPVYVAMSAGVGSAGLVFGFIRAPLALDQAATMASWWTVLAAAGFILPAAALTLTPFLGLRVAAVLANISALSFLAAGATALFAIPEGASFDALGTPWPLTISALASSIAAIWWRPSFAIAYLLATVVAVEGVRTTLGWTSFDLGFLLIDTAYTLLFNGVFVALALALRRRARTLDESFDTAAAETASAARAESRARETARVGALVHDTVLVALLSAARAEPGQEDAAAPLARRALAVLEAEDPDRDSAQTFRDTAWRIQATATEITPAAEVVISGELDHPLPPEVGAALQEASAEVLRNSRDYAGVAAQRIVVIHADRGRIRVEIVDDGAGFDPQQVPAHRLGIRVSVIDRMAAVGGAARIASRRGVGTRVRLEWGAR